MPTRQAEAPASIYAITNAQIRRAAATTLGEALRIAPNLQVARINSTGYAITARGFNNSFANKLLVLVDGRTIYTPLFSGFRLGRRRQLREPRDCALRRPARRQRPLSRLRQDGELRRHAAFERCLGARRLVEADDRLPCGLRLRA
jgi:hypothetical protein